MKKHYILNLLSSVILLYSCNVLGQAAILALLFGDKVASENFNLSMEIGGNLTYYSNLDPYKHPKIGINFGIGSNIKISEQFYISPAMFFLGNRSVQFNPIDLNSDNPDLNAIYTDSNATLNLRYLDIPVLFSYQNKSTKMRYSLGPQFSILKNSEMQYSSEFGDLNTDFSEAMATNDFGLVANISYILRGLKNGKEAHIHARYYHGLKNIFKDSFSGNENNTRYFSVIISFPFIK